VPPDQFRFVFFEDIPWPRITSSPSSAAFARRAFSLKIANALAKLAPPSLKLDVTTLHGISFFNQDLEANPPADWLAFREKLQKSHGVLFVTPEYNRAIPGVLKNAIDVGSRPYGKKLVPGKADRHHLQLAGPARRRQCGQEPAEHPAGHLRNDPGAARDLSEQCRRRLQREGRAGQGSPAEVLEQYLAAFAKFVERQNA